VDFGGRFEVVPASAVVVRFDVTHWSFSEMPAFSSFMENESRTYLKIALMVRVR